MTGDKLLRAEDVERLLEERRQTFAALYNRLLFDDDLSCHDEIERIVQLVRALPDAAPQAEEAERLREALAMFADSNNWETRTSWSALDAAEKGRLCELAWQWAPDCAQEMTPWEIARAALTEEKR